MHTKFWSKTLKGRDHFGHLGVCNRIFLDRILRIIGLGFNWLKTGAAVYTLKEIRFSEGNASWRKLRKYSVMPAQPFACVCGGGGNFICVFFYTLYTIKI